MTRDELEEVLTEVLHRRRAADDVTHDAHHRFIEAELRRRERRVEMWERFRMSFIGGLALGVLGGLAWVGQLVVSALRQGNHP